MISISNDFMEATFHEKGAELASFRSKDTGVEYIWQANPDHWGRHAPVLFPIVGKLKHDSYRVDGHSYELSQHGFARDRNFELVKAQQESCTFQLKWTEGSLASYPYKFILEISYELREKELITAYKVTNADNTEIYFSIGAHPAFNCPHLPGKKRSDYSLLFNQFESASKHLLDNGLFNGETKLSLDNQKALYISDDLFDEDALVFKGMKSNAVILNDGDHNVFEFKFENFPYLGIWSKSSESPFVCIEPWFGLADSVDHDQNYQTKEGINKLDIRKSFECQYSVRILED
ncbi:MAG: aldose 1-epimerase family protein [bacterium]|nr:aldose 1-epimerase family protein [bacterium]